MAGKEVGTLFLPSADRLNSKKYWIAFTLRSRGRLIIDEGAKKALLDKAGVCCPRALSMWKVILPSATR